MKKPRKKKCRACGEVFQPERPIQPCCSPSCAIELVRLQKEQKRKDDRKEFKRKVKLNDRSYQTKLAQYYFNRFIRFRDSGLPCISCGKYHSGQIHAGHYRSVGAVGALRFHEANCHAQCSVCNNHRSGNIVEYRINLIKKIGLERVEWLEKDHPPVKRTIEEIIEIKKHYQKLCNELEREAA